MDRKNIASAKSIASAKTVSAAFIEQLLDRAAVAAREAAVRVVNDPFVAEDMVERAVREIARMKPEEVGDLDHAEKLLHETVLSLCLRCIDGVPANDNGEDDAGGDDEDEGDEEDADFDP